MERDGRTKRWKIKKKHKIGENHSKAKEAAMESLQYSAYS